MTKMSVLSTICFLSIFYAGTLAYSQFVNNETIASSSSTYHNHFAPKTVDGSFDQNFSNCLHTDVNRQYRDAWLRIDLRKVYSVKSVKFWYRGDRGSPYKNTVRLRGYSLRVSNDTSVPPPESSCYNDTGIVTLPTIVEEDCKRTARYIWIHQTNKGNKDEWCPMLEICEVQVFGCDVGYYGENCSDRCHHCKNNATCGIQHGDCDDSGCVNPGKQPPRCKGCIIGMYGIYCENNCSLYCAYGDCDRTTGTCLDGCKIGYIGRFCNQTCSVGKYGRQCSESCGHCLNNSTCNHVDGSCKTGCEAGYKASDCKTPCDDGEYGQNCQYMCTGNCFNGEACDKVSGRCRSCVEGYQGFRCDRDIRQSPTSSDKKKNDVDDLMMKKMMLENEKTQKEIKKLEAETEVLRVRKNVLLRLQGILSELSQVATKLLKDN